MIDTKMKNTGGFPVPNGMATNYLDSLFNSILTDNVINRNSNKSFPKYNIIKHNDDNYTIQIALAGFNRDQVDLRLSNGMLTISGINYDEDKPSENYLVKNISNRSFELSFHITNYAEVKNAYMENGILNIDIQKYTKNDEGERIPIK